MLVKQMNYYTHTSLSCGGLVDKDAKVVCSRKQKQSGKCKHLVQLGYDKLSDTHISTNPLLANKIAIRYY